MNQQETIEFILDHYENPRNRGVLEPASVVMKGGNPSCGDVVTLFLRINPETQCVDEISFTGHGCTISQAAASLTTERIKGQSLGAVRTLRTHDLLAELGEGVFRSRQRCATLALHTLRAALTRYLHEHPDLAPVTPPEEREVLLRFEEQV